MKPVCLITGSGGRLGNALCAGLANEFDIVAAYRKNMPRCPSQLVRPIRKGTVNLENNSDSAAVYCVQADLSKPEDMRRLVEIAVARFGNIDVIINSAVNYAKGPKLLELSQVEDFASSKLYFNSVVPFLLVSMIFDRCWKDAHLENERVNRNVVNVSSIAGVKLFSTSESYYSASKSAMNMLTLHLAAELSPYGVRANAICPGTFRDAASTERVVDAIRQLMSGRHTGLIMSDV